MRRKCIIHHTATPSYTSLNSIESTHRRRGFTRSLLTGYHIGYTYLVKNDDGTVVQIRGNNEDTCAVAAFDAEEGKSFNRTSVSIALVADCEIEEPTKYSIKSIIETCKRLPNLEQILGHGEVADTLCPGKKLSFYLPMIRKEVFRRDNWIIRSIKTLLKVCVGTFVKIGRGKSQKS